MTSASVCARNDDAVVATLESANAAHSIGSSTYDGVGRRLRAATGTTAARITNYLWATTGELPQIALERDGADRLLRRYVYGAERISMNTGTTPFYYHYDPLGSMVNLTASTGASQWTHSYEPYGVMRTETKNNTKAPANFMKYVGEYLDPTGLYHLRARQYDGANGRFLATDPLPRPATAPFVSSYAYAEDQPTTLTDPSGLEGGSPCAGRAEVAAGTVAYDAARGWGSRYTGVSHGMRSENPAVRSRAGSALRRAGRSRFARSAGFRAAGRAVPGIEFATEYGHSRCQGMGAAQAAHRATIATVSGALGSAGAATLCAAPEIATLGGATAVCAVGVAGAGAGASYLGGRAADLAWALGTRIGDDLYDIFG